VPGPGLARRAQLSNELKNHVRARNVNGRAIQSPEAWFGAGLVLLAVGVAIEGASVTIGFGYDTVGPRAFPYLIAAGLFISGTGIFAGALSRDAPADKAEGHNWIAILAISGALIAQMLLMKPLGWIPVSTVAFAIVAWVFGSRRVLRNLAFGATLACATFILFNYGLGFRLPVGALVEALL
jgi:putative tricarboxylic transport membrane protein